MRSAAGDCYYAVFSTKLGWMALLARKNRLRQLVFGHPTKKSALAALDEKLLAAARPKNGDFPLVERLRAYAAGRPDDFRDVSVDWEKMTAFRRKVLEHCRRIPYGKTMTYGELAARAGSPRAARAVGSCMARNRVPLVIPCHRVVPAGGRLGDYSAPGGVETKRRLLDMERQANQ
ncbi:MAG: methylated-DNA--[protein]-cysteine S-methyltransferase [Pirellulales bacterium]|nr:methylated-DNA--[protein]-cysteine S-methyltransferase [Pirellulales bacterium]